MEAYNHAGGLRRACLFTIFFLFLLTFQIPARYNQAVRSERGRICGRRPHDHPDEWVEDFRHL